MPVRAQSSWAVCMVFMVSLLVREVTGWSFPWIWMFQPGNLSAGVEVGGDACDDSGGVAVGSLLAVLVDEGEEGGGVVVVDFGEGGSEGAVEEGCFGGAEPAEGGGDGVFGGEAAVEDGGVVGGEGDDGDVGGAGFVEAGADLDVAEFEGLVGDGVGHESSPFWSR